jgi:hypothetical protein
VHRSDGGLRVEGPPTSAGMLVIAGLVCVGSARLSGTPVYPGKAFTRRSQENEARTSKTILKVASNARLRARRIGRKP